VTHFVQVQQLAQRHARHAARHALPASAEGRDQLVRCVRGALWDAIVDLRPGSPTFGKSFGTELSAENRRMLYVPKGFAHGFVTLSDATEALYFVDEFYGPEQERIARWNDPRYGIQWPIQPVVLSDKDRDARDFDPKWHLGA